MVPQIGRIRGHHQVAPLGHYQSPGGWLPHAYPGPFGRSRRRPARPLMADRPGQAAGHGANRKSPPSGRSRRVYEFNQTRGRAPAEAVCRRRDQPGQPSTQAEQAYQEFQGRLRVVASAPAQTQERATEPTTRLRAPFDGIVGDIPVHVGDYVSPSTLLTTVDENADLEAYIYMPTERARRCAARAWRRYSRQQRAPA